MSTAMVQRAPLEARRRVWYTTGDVARSLHMTDEGVRHLVREGDLPCTRTVSGLHIFTEADVDQVAAKRNRARLRSVTALRCKKRGVRGGPRQGSLFAPKLQVVARGSVALGGPSRSRGITEEVSRVR